jgi:hypothetical protein
VTKIKIFPGSRKQRRLDSDSSSGSILMQDSVWETLLVADYMIENTPRNFWILLPNLAPKLKFAEKPEEF